MTDEELRSMTWEEKDKYFCSICIGNTRIDNLGNKHLNEVGSTHRECRVCSKSYFQIVNSDKDHYANWRHGKNQRTSWNIYS